jgi:hypothetical protein
MVYRLIAAGTLRPDGFVGSRMRFRWSQIVRLINKPLKFQPVLFLPQAQSDRNQISDTIGEYLSHHIGEQRFLKIIWI